MGAFSVSENVAVLDHWNAWILPKPFATRVVTGSGPQRSCSAPASIAPVLTITVCRAVVLHVPLLIVKAYVLVCMGEAKGFEAVALDNPCDGDH